MVTREEIAALELQAKKILSQLKDAKKEIEKVEIKPWQIARRVEVRPYQMPACTTTGKVTRNRVLIDNQYCCDEWTTILKLAKHVVADRSYEERNGQYGVFDSNSTYTNTFSNMTEDQLNAVVDFVEEMVQVYNKHFLKNHTGAKVKFAGDFLPRRVPVTSEKEKAASDGNR